MKKTDKKQQKNGTPTNEKTVPMSVPSVPKITDEDKERVSLYLAPTDKTRSMSLQLYCDPSRWSRVLDEADKWLYIKHDKDVDENGELKTPHYHLALHFKSPRYRRAIEKLFDLEGLTEDTTINFQRVGNLGKLTAYFTHTSKSAIEAKKHVYDDDELHSNDLGYFFAKCMDDEPLTNETFLDDLISPDMNCRRMACKYGRDYMKNYAQYTRFRDEVIAEEIGQIETIKRKQAHDELIHLLDHIDDRGTEPKNLYRELAECIVRTFVYDSPRREYSPYVALNRIRKEIDSIMTTEREG